MKKTVLHIFFALPILISAGFVQAVSEEQITALEQKSDLKRMEYKKLQAESIALNLELTKMNKQLVEAAKRVQKDEDSICKTEEDLKLLQNKLRVSEERFNKEYKNLADMLAAIQNLALHSTDPLILQPLTPVEIIRSAVLMRESVPYLQENADKIKKDLEELNAQKKAAHDKLLELSNKTEDLKQKQISIKKMIAEKGKLYEKLEGQKTKAKEDAVRLASEASDLKDLMEKALKEEELKRRKQEELKRAAREREKAEQRKLEEEQIKRLREGRAYGFEGQDLIEEETPEEQVSDTSYDVVQAQSSTSSTKKISAASGQFVRPVRGEIITSYGQETSKGVNAKGIVIKTRPEAQVVAPYDGTVVFSGPFKGYGNLIIINHGADVVSLVGGMSSVDTENGQMVLAGEPIGLMPQTQEAKLYMEIRKNTKPVNPVPWLGL